MTQTQLLRRRYGRRGLLLVWIAILGLVIIGLAGLALDTGYVFVTGHQLQNAADAAALAGAARVKFNTTAAKTDAVNTAATNKAAGANVQLDSTNDILVGSFNRTTHTFTAGGSPTNAVWVQARRTSGSPGGPVSLFFGPMFGITTSNVSRTATAMSGGTFSAGLVVLDPSRSSSIGLNGTPDINIQNGGIIVDSSSSSAVSLNGNASIEATQLRIVGNYSGGGNSHLPSKIYTGIYPVSDPLAAVPARRRAPIWA